MTTVTRSTPCLVAAGALICGCAIYWFARPFSAFAISAPVALPLHGQLPSFFHTLGFALACSLTAVSYRGALRLCLGWGAVEIIAEGLQHESLAVGWFGHYGGMSTYDPLDMVAIGAATLLAVWLTSITRTR